jgi:hypothetical protein
MQRLRRLEKRMDAASPDPDEVIRRQDEEARRRERVKAELAEFEAWRRSVSHTDRDAWKSTPEGKAGIEKLEEAIRRKGLGRKPKRGHGAYK